ncbi:unnamed protein product [Dicrocoelium dendriticum]|nr:unnamed protein product [Dicrocoelium dendriticum]
MLGGYRLYALSYVVWPESSLLTAAKNGRYFSLGVTQIDESERGVCLNIRASRSHAGCACGPINPCLPEKCSCIKNGVQCQVDRACFPCSCSSESCCNPHGRTEFPQEEVRAYVLSVLRRSQNKFNDNSDVSPDDSSCPRTENIAPSSASNLCTTHNSCCQRQEMNAHFLTPVTRCTSIPSFHDQEECAQFETVSYSLSNDTASSSAITVEANCNWTQSDLQCALLGSV